MALSLGILFGIIALISWGSADALTKKLTDKVGAWHAVLYRSFFSALILLSVSLYFTGTIFPSSRHSFLLLILIGFIGYISYVFYVKGIEVGNVSVISPIGHSSVIVTILLSLFFFKESLALIQMLAMAMIIAGVILISFKYSELKKAKRSLVKGLGFALAVVVGWGLLFFLWKIPLSDTSPFIVVFYLESLVFVFALISSIPMKKKLLLPVINRQVWFFSIFVGVVLAIGSLFYTLGINREFVSLVAPIATASPFIAVITAYLFLKERLELNQVIAVALIIIGLVTISL